ncbi:MAG: bifunctional oligoribonuclease/PAP phosphatase NrnA [Vulcanimicrobiota bacterium]
MSFEQNIPDQLLQALRASRRVLLAAHIGLDGDHLGSMLALRKALEILGKEVVAYLPETVPPNYHFLLDLDKLSPELPGHDFDTIITLECPNVARLPAGVEVKSTPATVINLDHHPDNEMYGQHIWVEPQAAALGEMICDLIERLDVPLDRAMAMGLYVAILTDTGSFQYSRVRPATHRRLARLLEFNLPTDLIARSIYRQSRPEVLKLLGHVLTDVSVTDNGQVAWAEIPFERMQSYGVRPEDTQFFIDDVDRVAGPEVVTLFRELGDGRIKVSLRSKDAPINAVAAKFGGGGHAKAAGCVVKGDLSEVRAMVVEAVTESLRVNA